MEGPAVAGGRWDDDVIWREFGRCRGVDPGVFHPEEDDEVAEARAKAVCAECPVREACLEHALTHRERLGVWGGLSQRERRRVLRRRRRVAS